MPKDRLSKFSEASTIEFNCQYMYIAKYVSRVSLRQFVQRKSAAILTNYAVNVSQTTTNCYVEMLRRRNELLCTSNLSPVFFFFLFFSLHFSSSRRVRPSELRSAWRYCECLADKEVTSSLRRVDPRERTNKWTLKWWRNTGELLPLSRERKSW